MPTGEIYDVADAVLRVFAEFGDYQHKQHNRLKFLIKSMGWERWLAEYRVISRSCVRSRAASGHSIRIASIGSAARQPGAVGGHHRHRGARRLRADPRHRHASVAAAGDQRHRRALAAKTNVRTQKQAGYSIAIVTIPLGDLTAPQFRIIADLAASFGDGTVRVTVEQNLVFRWVKTGRLHDFYSAIAAARLNYSGHGTIADVVSCPGAESCRLAVTQSRGLGHLLGEHLREHAEVAAAAGSGDIKISGCPNGCGQHHVASIGFQGSIRRLGERAVPQYFVMVGGGADGDGASFGRVAAKIPARRAPEAVDRLVATVQTERRDGERLADFYRRADLAHVKDALSDLERLTDADARPEDFIDLAEDHDVHARGHGRRVQRIIS